MNALASISFGVLLYLAALAGSVLSAGHNGYETFFALGPIAFFHFSAGLSMIGGASIGNASRAIKLRCIRLGRRDYAAVLCMCRRACDDAAGLDAAETSARHHRRNVDRRGIAPSLSPRTGNGVVVARHLQSPPHPNAIRVRRRTSVVTQCVGVLHENKQTRPMDWQKNRATNCPIFVDLTSSA